MNEKAALLKALTTAARTVQDTVIVVEEQQRGGCFQWGWSTSSWRGPSRSGRPGRRDNAARPRPTASEQLFSQSHYDVGLHQQITGQYQTTRFQLVIWRITGTVCFPFLCFMCNEVQVLPCCFPHAVEYSELMLLSLIDW